VNKKLKIYDKVVRYHSRLTSIHSPLEKITDKIDLIKFQWK